MSCNWKKREIPILCPSPVLVRHIRYRRLRTSIWEMTYRRDCLYAHTIISFQKKLNLRTLQHLILLPTISFNTKPTWEVTWKSWIFQADIEMYLRALKVHGRLQTGLPMEKP